MYDAGGRYGCDGVFPISEMKVRERNELYILNQGEEMCRWRTRSCGMQDL